MKSFARFLALALFWVLPTLSPGAATPAVRAAADFIEAGGSSTFFDPLSNDAAFGLQALDPFSFRILDEPSFGLVDVTVSDLAVDAGYYRLQAGTDHVRYEICTYAGQCDVGMLWFFDASPGPYASASPDRGSPLPLELAALSGPAFVFLPDLFPEGAVKSVRFLIDGEPAGFERVAPYDLAGGGIARALPFDTMVLGDGPHVLTTEIKFSMEFGGGRLERFDTVMEVLNAPFLAYSYSNDRTSAGVLDGGFFGGIVHVFLGAFPLNPGAGPVPFSGLDVASVDFLLDGEVVRTERAVPYDFAGGSASLANPFDMSGLEPGNHVMDAVIRYGDGGAETIKASFRSIR